MRVVDVTLMRVLSWEMLIVKAVFHRRSSSTEDRLPPMVVFHRRSSYTEGRSPPKVIFHLFYTKRNIFSHIPLEIKTTFRWHTLLHIPLCGIFWVLSTLGMVSIFGGVFFFRGIFIFKCDKTKVESDWLGRLLRLPISSYRGSQQM